MNRRRLIAIAALLALVAVAVATRGFGLMGSDRDETLTLYGNVDVREVDLAFRVPGRIDSIAVEEGAKVKRGQRLAALDTASLDAQIARADADVARAEAELARLTNGSRPQEIAQTRAQLAAAQAALVNAERDYARRQPLVEPGAISAAVWAQTVAARDRARAEVAEARQALSLAQDGARAEDIRAAGAQVAAARAARQSASVDRGDGVLTASVDGTVVTRAREPGAIVQPGETVLTLSIDRPLRVRAYVGEPDLSRVRPGMRVTIKADGNPKAYRGTIGYISPRSEFTPKSVETEDLRTDLVYRLRINVEDADDALRQGQPVTVTIPTTAAAED